MDPEKFLEKVERELVTIPQAVRYLKATRPDGAWYTQKLIRRIQDGDLPAARVGGEYSDGFYLIPRDFLDGLPENKRTASQREGQEVQEEDQGGSGEESRAED